VDITSLYKVPLPSVVQDFQKHIDIDYNKRILFSARFGAGKSTFLNEYFADQGEDFIVLKLYPVNYSVASNEDVFELIKYDLFSELLAKYADKLDMTDDDFSTLFVAQSYLLHDVKVYPFIKALLKAAVPNGEAIAEIVDAAKDIYKGFKNYQEKIKKKEIDVIEDYIGWCEQRKGSIYEKDEITSLISDLILRVKQKLNNKPVVLIIDDLDRLDPEHVFRLFNVFSSHYDSITDINKFGLDKVIFVCDYHNILLMYKHRYGDGVDFDGYINKFYSINVFNFNTTKHLLESIEELLLRKPSDPNVKKFNRYGTFDTNSYLVKGLVLLFADLIRSKLITFRSLDQFKHYFVSEYQVRINEKTFNASQFYFVTFINLITQSISINALEEALTELGNNSRSYTNIEYRNNDQSAYVWLMEKALFSFLTGKQIYGNTDDKEAEIAIDNQVYKLSLTYSHDTGLVLPKFDMPPETKFNIYKILKSAIKAGRGHNIFR